MSQFKGTKGIWETCHIRGVGTIVKCFCKKKIKTISLLNQNNHEDAYNALLISKAPEMLEMLIDIKDYLGSDKRAEVEKLIESATKI